jgi:hypothetical protein
MSARLALGLLATAVMVAACATTGGGSGASPGKEAPAGAGAVASSSPAAGTGAPTTADASSAATSSGAASSAAASGAAASTASGRSGGSADPGLPAKTPAEQRAAIDSRLDASLNGFDDRLRQEQQRTAAQRDAQPATSNAGAGVDPDTSLGGERRADRDEIRHDRSGDLQSAGVQQEAGPAAAAASAGQQGSGASGASSNPIPSGADDDIVARRLRRAAENETDPELKEKLWKEYRDYKENTKGST